jgi:hypothetical protein
VRAIGLIPHLRRILERDYNPFSQLSERRLNPLGLCVVLWIKHSSHKPFR